MTDLDTLVIEPLGKRHDRAAFSCGIPELDRYLARLAGQDVRRRIARVFVCTAEGSDTVLGFYTLSALAIDLSSLPEELSRKLPRHPVPCALIGRLAIDQSVRGHGLGRMLLVDAIKRTMGASDIMAIHAVIVDAKNNAAKQFYERFWFRPYAGTTPCGFFYRSARSIFRILLQTGIGIWLVSKPSVYRAEQHDLTDGISAAK